MKTDVTVALILLACVLAGGLWMTANVEATAARIEASAAEIGELAAMGEWGRAAEALDSYEAQWKKSLGWLRLLTPDDKTDGVSECYRQLGTHIQLEDATGSAEACTALQLAAEAMLDNERLTWQTLL